MGRVIVTVLAGGCSTTATARSVPGSPFDGFTTSAMEELLAETHSSGGGWLLESDHDYSIGVWHLRPAAQEPVSEGPTELWLQEEIARTGDGGTHPVWRRLDGLVVEDLAREWLAAVVAWEADLAAGVFGAEPLAGVECENEAYGV